jgi:hypothetical protein
MIPIRLPSLRPSRNTSRQPPPLRLPLQGLSAGMLRDPGRAPDLWLTRLAFEKRAHTWPAGSRENEAGVALGARGRAALGAGCAGAGERGAMGAGG